MSDLTRFNAEKNTRYLSLKAEILITKFTRPFYSVSHNCRPVALMQDRFLWQLVPYDQIVCKADDYLHNKLSYVYYDVIIKLVLAVLQF